MVNAYSSHRRGRRRKSSQDGRSQQPDDGGNAKFDMHGFGDFVDFRTLERARIEVVCASVGASILRLDPKSVLDTFSVSAF